MRAVVSIANEIYAEYGLPRINALVSSDTQQARRMLGAMNASGRALRQFDWDSLQVVTTVSASGSAEFGLPSDFRSLVPMTIWNITEGWQARGPVRADELQELEGGLVTVGIYDTWRIQLSGTERKIRVVPTPGDGENFSFAYHTTNWVFHTSASALAGNIQADDDTVLFDEDLFHAETTWRFLRAMGAPYGDEKNDAERMRNIKLAEDGGMQEIHAGRSYADGPFPAYSPETSVGL